MNEPVKLDIVRLVRQGAGLYLCVPRKTRDFLGWKAGDRLICDHDEETVFLKRLPLESFLPLRKTPANPIDHMASSAAKVSTVR